MVTLATHHPGHTWCIISSRQSTKSALLQYTATRTCETCALEISRGDKFILSISIKVQNFDKQRAGLKSS